MICSAIGNADPTGLRRSVQSVEALELTGIQAPFEKLVKQMSARVEKGADSFLDYVAVTWADDMPPRVARFHGIGKGCAIQPIGRPLPTGDTTSAMPIDRPVPPGTSPRPQAQISGKAAVLARTAFEPRYGAGARTTAVLIQRGGRIVGEAYAPGFDGDLPQRTWSVAKSLATTLVGAAVQRGEANVTASAGLGDGPDDPRRAITIDQLLRMASGRYSDTPGNRSDPVYFGGSSVEETATGWPLIVPPGRVFRYANNDTLAAVRAIKGSFAAHPPREFLDRIGMTGTVVETDVRGDYVLSSQVWASARDLATLGQLYLQRGAGMASASCPRIGWHTSPARPARSRRDRWATAPGSG